MAVSRPEKLPFQKANGEVNIEILKGVILQGDKSENGKNLLTTVNNPPASWGASSAPTPGTDIAAFIPPASWRVFSRRFL